MSDGYKKVEGVGEAAVWRGDPRGGSQGTSSIDQWYQWIMSEVRGASARPHLYGSDAGFCARRNVLLAYNEEIAYEKDATAVAYMAIGVAYENALADALKRRERLVGQGFRLPIFPEVKISGILDLLIFDNENDLAIVEVKTCGKLPDKPKPQHLAQAQIYAATTGLRKVWLSYFSRNVQLVYGEGLSVRSFPVDTSDEALAARLATAFVSNWSIGLGGLPPVPAAFRKHTECHVCEFRDFFCWGGRKGGSPLLEPPEPPPLPPLTTSEYISLSTKAEALAKEVISNQLYHKKTFLESVLDSNHLLSSLVEEEYKKVMDQIVKPTVS